jgi:RNA-binding protein YhbY
MCWRGSIERTAGRVVKVAVKKKKRENRAKRAEGLFNDFKVKLVQMNLSSSLKSLGR